MKCHAPGPENSKCYEVCPFSSDQISWNANQNLSQLTLGIDKVTLKFTEESKESRKVKAIWKKNKAGEQAHLLSAPLRSYDSQSATALL